MILADIERQDIVAINLSNGNKGELCYGEIESQNEVKQIESVPISDNLYGLLALPKISRHKMSQSSHWQLIWI